MSKNNEFNKSPKLSVIIPVYNAETYISQCLDSIINQTLKDIEIICVNDGSTDNSLKILKDYESKDCRIKVIDKKNGGAGSARNMGLSMASGQYVNFVDSDDWLDTSAYEILFNKCIEDDLDAILFQLINYDNDTGELYEDHSYNVSQIDSSFDEKVFNHSDIQGGLFYLTVSPCNKLYRREILKGIKFPEGVMFEDNPFFFEVFLRAERVSIIRKHFYFRRRHSTSVMTNRGKKLLDAIEISNEIVEAVKRAGFYEVYKVRVLNHKVMMVVTWYNNVDEDNKQVYFLEMKKDFNKIKSNESLFKEYEDSLFYDRKTAFHKALEADTYKEFDLLVELDTISNELNDVKSKNQKLQEGFDKVSVAFDSLSKEFVDIIELTKGKFEGHEDNVSLGSYKENLQKSNLRYQAQNEYLLYQNKALKRRIDELNSSNNGMFARLKKILSKK